MKRPPIPVRGRLARSDNWYPSGRGRPRTQRPLNGVALMDAIEGLMFSGM